MCTIALVLLLCACVCVRACVRACVCVCVCTHKVRMDVSDKILRLVNTLVIIISSNRITIINYHTLVEGFSR